MSKSRLDATIKRLAATAVLCSMLAAPAVADLPAAIEAYDQADFATAFEEARQPAEHGEVDAQFMMGFLYARGEGVPRDLVQAYLWFSLAARQGDSFAAEALVRLAQQMTDDRIATAKALARDWVPTSK